MHARQWIPRRSDLPGIALAAGLGLAAAAATRLLPRSPLLSETLVALVLGALAVNTPLRRVLKLIPPGEGRDCDRYAAGLRFVGKWLLRASIIAMGLKVEARFLGADSIALILGVVAITLPVAFLVTHALAGALGVRRPLADVIAGGTMICGASAVNALAPVVGARRQEQAIALGTMYFFSLVALLLFRPVAALLGLPPTYAGIWSGLAVNDLASSVAIGAQMGDGGGAMAAAAKSLRVVLLAPALIFFALARRDEQATPKELGRSARDAVPLFVLGYVALALVRTAGDRLLGAAGTWRAVLAADHLFVNLGMAAVAAAIGLHLDVRRLLAAGVRALALAGLASIVLAGLSLAMVCLTARGASKTAALLGASAVLCAFILFRLTTGAEAARRALERRFRGGAPLSLAEATKLLSHLEDKADLSQEDLRRVMRQLHPAIGELIPIRQSPLAHGQGCRWATYWEGKHGWALVALCREPGSVTPIHAHPHRLIGKAIEGRLEELVFDRRRADALELVSRRVLDHNELVETNALDTIHLVRAAGRVPSVDLQLRGPEVGQPGQQFVPAGVLDIDNLAVGTVIAARVGVDERPGHGGEGAHAGAFALKTA